MDWVFYFCTSIFFTFSHWQNKRNWLLNCSKNFYLRHPIRHILCCILVFISIFTNDIISFCNLKKNSNLHKMLFYSSYYLFKYTFNNRCKFVPIVGNPFRYSYIKILKYSNINDSLCFFFSNDFRYYFLGLNFYTFY